ncbi:MAG: nicotinate (nicotinamide) nucleotide adenylyltransferase [Burkholderiales bacterium]|nr:nicotinate (nicotinamide) nucleotide adenylyltransferase [Burkholderiales bacterium]MBK9345172.1 nicotinate (nicotinamide) nucleotide adenylyltransferase [Burkholderiales bacterium]
MEPVVLRVGVFGGAFDPPHRGHVALAQTALQQLQLDVLHAIPTGQAWHKSRDLTAGEHRLAMTRLAFEGIDRVQVDAREIARSGPSYTVDTLTELQAAYPQAQLYLLVGEDQAQALPTWHRWQALVRLAIICVAARADHTGATGQFDALKSLLPDLRILKMPPLAISATDIRRRLAHHENVIPLVFEPVARYIDHHHLYQAS